MIDKRTVFILGAGAHVPYGFPTMSMLKQEIIKSFPQEYGNFTSKRWMPDFSEREARKFVDSFYSAGIDSIDLYLSENKNYPNFLEMGKASIFYYLLENEKKYLGAGYQDDADDWLNILYNKLIYRGGNKGLEYFPVNKIVFITFNYDRLLEYLLLKKMRYTYLSEQDKVEDVFNNLKIYHVYGSLGKFKYKGRKINDHDTTELKFGENIDYAKDGLKALENIRLIHDNQNEENQCIKDEIYSAEQIFFLGFGYSKENLKVLGIPSDKLRGKEIFGSAFLREEGEIKRDIQYLMNNNIYETLPIKVQIENKTCSAILRNYLADV